MNEPLNDGKPLFKEFEKLIGIPFDTVLGITTTIAGISMMKLAEAILTKVVYPEITVSGQGPHCVTFDSMSECPQFVKDNYDLGLFQERLYNRFSFRTSYHLLLKARITSLFLVL